MGAAAKLSTKYGVGRGVQQNNVRSLQYSAASRAQGNEAWFLQTGHTKQLRRSEISESAFENVFSCTSESSHGLEKSQPDEILLQ